MKLCLIQPTGSSPLMFFQIAPVFSGFSEYEFGDTYRELTQVPEAAGSKFLHLNIFFQKVRTKQI